jgi:hypothetical protein
MASRSTTSGWFIAVVQAIDPAPVVTDQQRGLGTEFSDQVADVGGEQVDCVVVEALWLR